jgi:hypothetical protein
LLFVPLGLIMALDPMAPDSGPVLRHGRALALASGLFLVLALIAARDHVAALGYADLGSVAQTKLELRNYAFPERLADYVRHDADMSVPQSYFEQALSHDAANLTARQRLAELALGRAEHDAARLYLEPVGAPAGPVTRQLLCEAYLGLGRSDDAFALCSTVPGAAVRLEGVAYVRYERNKDMQRADWARSLAAKLKTTRPGQ